MTAAASPPPRATGYPDARPSAVLGKGAAPPTLSFLNIPLLACDRKPFGPTLAESTGHINDWPLTVAVTPVEIHISFADRDGPTFVIDLNAIVKAAVTEIEAKLGLKPRNRK